MGKHCEGRAKRCTPHGQEPPRGQRLMLEDGRVSIAAACEAFEIT